VAEVEAANRFLGQLGKAPCKTKDGERIELLVNTAVLSDIRRADEVGAEGVGLFRTEVSFMISQRFPSENEQVQHYRQQLVAFHPRPVTMRTLDIGGDKALPYFPITEANPYLGWRGIRVTLDHPEIFMVQVRAMLRASEGLNNLRILLPMVTSVDECRRARGLIDRVFNELVDAGFNVRMPAIGVMVEVPAMALQLRDFLPQVEFLSVGSNDLIQYLLAVDRNNARVRQVYNECHPAFLRLLAELVRQCREVGRPLGICGELAGRAPMAVLLVGMGFRQLSMHANALPRIKWVFSHLDLAEIERLTAQVLAYEDADRIESELRHFFDHKQLIRFFR
jgi:phosphotransferase system enzyme I (PtsP)